MTATTADASTHCETAQALFTIWAEGFAATGEAETAWQLNEAPIMATSLDEAVRQYMRTSDTRHLFQRQSDGAWTYWGCRLFDNEADARGAFG
jgi:hypothetical protein